MTAPSSRPLALGAPGHAVSPRGPWPTAASPTARLPGLVALGWPARFAHDLWVPLRPHALAGGHSGDRMSRPHPRTTPRPRSARRPGVPRGTDRGCGGRAEAGGCCTWNGALVRAGGHAVLNADHPILGPERWSAALHVERCRCSGGGACRRWTLNPRDPRGHSGSHRGFRGAMGMVGDVARGTRRRLRPDRGRRRDLCSMLRAGSLPAKVIPGLPGPQVIRGLPSRR
jgi:hypothetical protein